MENAKNNNKPIQNINTINKNLINLKMINKSVFDVIMKRIQKENYFVPSYNNKLKVYLKNDILNFGNNIIWTKISSTLPTIRKITGVWTHSANWNVTIERNQFNPFIFDAKHANGVIHKLYIGNKLLYSDLSFGDKGILTNNNTRIKWIGTNSHWRKKKLKNYHLDLEHFTNFDISSNNYLLPILLAVLVFFIYQKTKN